MTIETAGQGQDLPVCIRPLQSEDLPQMLALQEAVYPPALHESAQVLSSKISMVPAGWASLAATQGERLCAYALGYPWRSTLQPRWNHPLAQHRDCDVLYVHDVAVSKACTGRGIAGRLVSQLLLQGARYRLDRAILIAVEGAQDYWLRHGFVAVDTGQVDPAFGSEAVMMLRRLDPIDPESLVRQ